MDDEVRYKLIAALKNIYDNDTFIDCIIGESRTVENWQTIIDFIDYANQVGDDVTHDDVVALSLVLRRRLDGKTSPSEEVASYKN